MHLLIISTPGFVYSKSSFSSGQQGTQALTWNIQALSWNDVLTLISFLLLSSFFRFVTVDSRKKT